MSERTRNWLIGALVVALLALTATLLTVGRSAGTDRAQQLEERLRCPTCKTVSIAESPSRTAAGMRRIVAKQVEQGRSDKEILAYFTTRYGGWVVMDAPPAGKTLPLWLLVVATAGVGVAVLVKRAARSRRWSPHLGSAQRVEVQAALADYVSRDPEDHREP